MTDEQNHKPLSIVDFEGLLLYYNKDSDKSAEKVHPFFEDLAFNTVKNYKHSSKVLAESLRECFPPTSDRRRQLTPADAQQIVDNIVADRGPGSARVAVSTVGSILSYMILYRPVTTSVYNAFDHVKIPKGEMIDAWTDAQIKQHTSTGSEFLVTLVTLLLETGQRLSDIVDLRWPQIEYNLASKEWTKIYIVQKKTGTKVSIPVTKELNKILRTLNVLIKHGQHAGKVLLPVWGLDRSITEDAVRYRYKTICDAFGIPPLQLHGLRKSAIIRMIDGGATLFEVMSVTGHKSVSSLRHYMEGYDKVAAAERAFAKAGLLAG